MSWNGITPAWALVDPREDGGNVHNVAMTTEQVEMLDEIMRQDMVDFPEAYADSSPFKALYTRIQTILASIGE